MLQWGCERLSPISHANQPYTHNPLQLSPTAPHTPARTQTAPLYSISVLPLSLYLSFALPLSLSLSIAVLSSACVPSRSVLNSKNNCAFHFICSGAYLYNPPSFSHFSIASFLLFQSTALCCFLCVLLFSICPLRCILNSREQQPWQKERKRQQKRWKVESSLKGCWGTLFYFTQTASYEWPMQTVNDISKNQYTQCVCVCVCIGQVTCLEFWTTYSLFLFSYPHRKKWYMTIYWFSIL